MTDVSSTDVSSTSHRTCKRCGRKIVWGRRPGFDKWHPPLGYVGTAYVVLDGVVYKVPTYLVHECHPDDVLRHQAEVEQDRAERRAAYRATPAYLEEREIEAQLLTIFNEESMKIACPKCDMPIDRMCINLSKTRSGQQVEVKKAHIERWRAALAANPDIGDAYGPPDPRKDECPNGE